MTRRIGIRVRGAVQGVGFRPFVYRLALRHDLAGFVANDAEGVLIEAEGTSLAGFLEALAAEAPPLARIDGIATVELTPNGEAGFVVAPSAGGRAATMITPDTATCPECLAELFDPDDRRWRYPFINCTNCGPRYTITRRLPYDRAETSMAAFALCPDCGAEYRDPADRRFHAEPNACPACGPHLERPIEWILARLRAGDIIALKGLGGFHLVCDAANETAVATLRRRKDREEKPFAVMVANLASAATLADITPGEADLIAAPARPIVLCRRRPQAPLAPSIAPGLESVGLMLPYTPIHYLLFHEAAGRPPGMAWLARPHPLALVMTSANPGGEPLVIDDADARRRLAAIADHIVGHDRDIVVRADDSVVRLVDGAPLFIRRARGYVPEPIRLSRELPPVLALGGHLKSTVCAIRGNEAFLSQHIGDMDTAETARFFEETVAHLLSILEIEPVAVAHDLHTDFFSTRHAEAMGLPTVPVQHHHAHISAVAAEYRIDGPLLGLSLDGYGLGSDGGAWGGELILAGDVGFSRLGHLAELPQPGGDRAAREPWRMAAAALHVLGRGDEIARRFPAEPLAGALAAMLEAGGATAPTSSCGRLFDAACGLLGILPKASFEGQAPMMLEAQVETPRVLAGGWRITGDTLDLRPLLAALLDSEPQAGAELFHGTLAAALADWVEIAAREQGLDAVALTGGCFLNRVLAESLCRDLACRGIRPCCPAGRRPVTAASPLARRLSPVVSPPPANSPDFSGRALA
ncbi:MAG: carbamoyltransferase HypF [Hyphomicrobiales bacterium]